MVGAACGDATNTAPTTVQPAATPAHVLIRDNTYVEAVSDQAETQKLDIYAPTATGSHPVVVLLHGGGASKDNRQVTAVSQQLAEAGMVVFVPTHGSAATPERIIANDGQKMWEALVSTLCALKYASQHAAEHGGDPAQVSVVGHSAGGLLGIIAVLGNEGVEEAWKDFGAARGIQQQLRCVSTADLPSISGFVGYAGAYFVFLMSGLPESDPQLWALVNPRDYLATGSSRIVLMYSGNDEVTPDWHFDEVTLFAEELRGSGYDAEIVLIEDAVHDWSTTGPIWDTTLETILEVAVSA